MLARIRWWRLNRQVLVAACSASVLALAGCYTPVPSKLPADGLGPLVPPDPPDSRPCKLDLVGNLLLRESGGHILIDASVNDQPVRMVLDTGADYTILTPQAEKRLHLDRENWPDSTVAGIGGTRKSTFFQAETLRLGNLYGTTWNFLVADVAATNVEPKPDGLLGADLLRLYDFDLDLLGGYLRIFYPEHDCSQPSAYLTGPLHMVDLETTIMPGVAVSFNTLALVKLHVRIGDRLLVAEIDSGAPHNVLFLSGLAKLNWSTEQFTADKRGLAGGIGPDLVPTIYHIIPTVGIGDLKIANVPVNAVNTSMGPGGPDIILGLELLRRVHVWISHSSAQVILQMPPMPSPPLPELPTSAGKT